MTDINDNDMNLAAALVQVDQALLDRDLEGAADVVVRAKERVLELAHDNAALRRRVNELVEERGNLLTKNRAAEEHIARLEAQRDYMRAERDEALLKAANAVRERGLVLAAVEDAKYILNSV